MARRPWALERIVQALCSGRCEYTTTCFSIPHSASAHCGQKSRDPSSTDRCANALPTSMWVGPLNHHLSSSYLASPHAPHTFFTMPVPVGAVPQGQSTLDKRASPPFSASAKALLTVCSQDGWYDGRVCRPDHWLHFWSATPHSSLLLCKV